MKGFEEINNLLFIYPFLHRCGAIKDNAPREKLYDFYKQD